MDTDNKAALPPKRATFTVAGFALEFKAPTQADWDLSRKKSRSEKHSAAGATRELLQQCLVSPLEDFQSAVRKKPASPVRIWRAVAVMAGQDIEPVLNADGETATLSLSDGRSWTFNTPSFESWEDCQEQIARGKQREEVFRELAIRCAVDSKGLSSFFEEYPAAHEALSGALTELAGGAIEEEVKKE